MRSVAVFVKGPGAGRESALRALQTVGLQGHAHSRRDARPPQRLPSAQAAARLTDVPAHPVAPVRDEAPRRVNRFYPLGAKKREEMARYIGPVCKLCRREGMKLFLKGERCYTEKCSYTRRPYPPGQHGQARIKLSEYAIRLREKQKVRRIYGVLERQFQKYYFDATPPQGPHGRADARPARVAPRQRRAPPRLRVHARRRRASSCGTATCSSTASASTSRAHPAPGRQDRDSPEEPRDQGDRRVARAGRQAPACCRGSSSTRRTSSASSRARRFAKR